MVVAALLQPCAHHLGRHHFPGGGLRGSQLWPVVLRAAGGAGVAHAAIMLGWQHSMSQLLLSVACPAEVTTWAWHHGQLNT